MWPMITESIGSIKVLKEIKKQFRILLKIRKNNRLDRKFDQNTLSVINFFYGDVLSVERYLNTENLLIKN